MPRTQVVFEVIFHKTELVDELADMATSHQDERCQCLGQIEAIIRRCAEVGELAHDIDAALAAQGLNALMVGIMHQWVLDPAAYDLAAAAPALIDDASGRIVGAPAAANGAHDAAGAGEDDVRLTHGRRTEYPTAQAS